MDTTKLDAVCSGLLNVSEPIPNTAGYPAQARADIDWRLATSCLATECSLLRLVKSAMGTLRSSTTSPRGTRRSLSAATQTASRRTQQRRIVRLTTRKNVPLTSEGRRRAIDGCRTPTIAHVAAGMEIPLRAHRSGSNAAGTSASLVPYDGDTTGAARRIDVRVTTSDRRVSWVRQFARRRWAGDKEDW